MTTIDIAQAKERFADVMERVSNGEEVIIEKDGRAMAKVIPLEQPPRRPVRLGGLEGKIDVPRGYEDKEDPEILRMFGIE